MAVDVYIFLQVHISMSSFAHRPAHSYAIFLPRDLMTAMSKIFMSSRPVRSIPSERERLDIPEIVSCRVIYATLAFVASVGIYPRP